MLGQSGCYFIKYCSLVIYRLTQLENQQEGGATGASVQNCRFYTNFNLPTIIEAH